MIANDIVTYLDSRGIAVKNTNLFLNFQKDSPDNCITVYDESAPVLPESSCLAVDNYGIQVLVRNASSVSAAATIKEIHNILAGFGGGSFVTGNDIVSYMTVVNSPYFIGLDSKNRHEWTTHYIARTELVGVSENRL
ncbi:MAG: minor capsid protein [Clostridiales bacterium]